MSPELIELQYEDYDLVKEIYDFYVINSTATFRTEKISLSELKETVLIGHPKYKSYLIKWNGSIAGFCYFSQYRKKQAYDRTAEVTIYLKPEFSGKGMGKKALDQLKTIALKNGIKVLVAIITAENEISINLFKKCGFEKCAHFRKVGEKFNRLLDVVALQFVFDE
jgi:phosphinothricin acetyltransferase